MKNSNRKVFQEVAKGFGTVFTQINNAENLLQNLLGRKVVQSFCKEEFITLDEVLEKKTKI